MQKRNMIVKGLLLAPLSAALLIAGCSDGGDDPPQATTLSGKVIQGPVSGARVFADLDGDRKPGGTGEVEADGVTGADGSFTFSTAPTGDYVLVTIGGTDELTKEPAYPALAPKGAKNITPLTTLVATAAPAEQEAVKAILNQLAAGNGYDLDLSSTAGVPADVMKVAKSVEGALKVFADLGVTTPSAQRAIFKETAKQLVEVNKATPSASVDTLIQNAVAASAAAIATDPTLLSAEKDAPAVAFAVDAGNVAAFANIVKEAATQINSAIPAGTVTETTVQTGVISAINTVITGNSSNLGSLVKTVALKVGEVRGYASGATTAAFTVSGADLDSLIPVPPSVSVLAADLSLRNDFPATQSYPSVSLALVVKDNNSARQAIVTVADLKVDVTAEGASITVDDSAAKLTILGKTKAGDVVTNVQPFAGPFSGFIFEGKTVKFDLDAIGELVASKTELKAFTSLNEVGTYTVSVVVGGAPVASRSLQVKVQ